MATNEKEINVNLLERLDLIDRIRAVIDNDGTIEDVTKQLDFEEKLIKRKLYQTPPLQDE